MQGAGASALSLALSLLAQHQRQDCERDEDLAAVEYPLQSVPERAQSGTHLNYGSQSDRAVGRPRSDNVCARFSRQAHQSGGEVLVSVHGEYGLPAQHQRTQVPSHTKLCLTSHCQTEERKGGVCEP